jgi:hypothetical protein
VTNFLQDPFIFPSTFGAGLVIGVFVGLFFKPLMKFGLMIALFAGVFYVLYLIKLKGWHI